MKTNKQTKGERKRERKKEREREGKRLKERTYIYFLLKSICRPLFHFIEFQRFRNLLVSIPLQ